MAFHGVRARSRQERRHSVNRDATEKERLRDRREKFDVYAEPGQVVAPDAKDSALFMSSGDRFFTDMGAEQRHEREEALHKRQAVNPGAGAYHPSAHRAQVLVPLEALKRPFGQALHCSAAYTAKKPAGQVEHADAPCCDGCRVGAGEC